MTSVSRTLAAAVLAPLVGTLLFLCAALPFNRLTHEGDLAAVRAAVLAADARGAFRDDPRLNLRGMPLDPVRGSDQFTDCIVLLQILYRHDDPLADAVDSRMGEFKPLPCARLVEAAAGTLTPTYPYFRYWMGSRHLLQAFLPALPIEAVRTLYKAFSYGAVALAVAAAFLVSVPVGLAVLPAGAALGVGLGLDVFGQHLGHAPTYFVPLALTALLCALSARFVGIGRRLVAVSVIAACTTYFDILSGGLPFMLAWTLALTHLCYGSALAPHGRDASPVLSFVAVGAVFTATVGLVILAKLAAVSVVGMEDPFGLFLRVLSIRMGSAVAGDTVTHAAVFEKLWVFRAFAFSGNTALATAVYLGGVASWLAAAAVAVLPGRRRRGSGRGGRDVALLFAAALTVAAWYAAFVNHTFIHTWFMGRVMTLPAALGFTALALALLAARPAGVTTPMAAPAARARPGTG